MPKWTQKEKELLHEIYFVKKLPLVILANALGRPLQSIYSYMKYNNIKSNRRKLFKGSKLARNRRAKQLRAQGMKHREIAAVLGVSQGYIARILNYKEDFNVAKAVQMFEDIEHGLHDTEEEADLADAKIMLHRSCKFGHLSDDRIELLDELLDNAEMMKAFGQYAKQRQIVKAIEEQHNQQDPKVTEVLRGKDNRT